LAYVQDLREWTGQAGNDEEHFQPQMCFKCAGRTASMAMPARSKDLAARASIIFAPSVRHQSSQLRQISA